MKNLNSKVTAIVTMLFISFSMIGQNAFFSKTLVNTILAQQGCTGLRMYPVVDKSRNVNSVMIAGIDAQGNEVSSKYQIYTGIKGNKPSYSSLGKSEARSACDSYFSSNESFVSDISRNVVEGFLNGTLGISIQADRGKNFLVSGYTQGEGPMPSGSSKPGDPCPSACGAASQYLISPIH